MSETNDTVSTAVPLSQKKVHAIIQLIEYFDAYFGKVGSKMECHLHYLEELFDSGNYS